MTSLKQFVGNVSAELSGSSEAEKNMLSLPVMYYAIWQRGLQRNGNRLWVCNLLNKALLLEVNVRN